MKKLSKIATAQRGKILLTDIRYSGAMSELVISSGRTARLPSSALAPKTDIR